jgi:hypothetical protein
MFPLIFWLFYLYDIFIKSDPPSTFLMPVLIATGLGIAVFGWRYWAITSLLNHGQETPATVHEIGFYRDRGRVAYVYTFQGQKYLTGNRIMKTKQTRSLQVGDQVTVLVDPNNAKRVVMRDLFTN